jgi:hypothetical protein
MAFWRNGDGFNVAIDCERGVWHDHAHGEGGGILALVQTALGCDKPGAVAWLEQNGFIAARDPHVRRVAADARRDVARDLPGARLWRSASIDLAEENLVSLKSALFNPEQPSPDGCQIRLLTGFVAALRRADDAGVVRLYREWMARCPNTTKAMVDAARRRELADRAALRRFVEAML